MQVGEDAPIPGKAPRPLPHRHQDRHDGRGAAGRARRTAGGRGGVVGSNDHGNTHSLYILDPDGNEIELYIDVQPETWREEFAREVPLRPALR